MLFHHNEYPLGTTKYIHAAHQVLARIGRGHTHTAVSATTRTATASTFLERNDINELNDDKVKVIEHYSAVSDSTPRVRTKYPVLLPL